MRPVHPGRSHPVNQLGGTLDTATCKPFPRIEGPGNHASLRRMGDDLTPRILAAVELLGSKFEHLDSKVERLDGKLGQLRGEVDRLRGDVMARMDRLQDGFNALRDNVTVNFGRTERAETTVRASADEVRAMGIELSGMHRQIQRLQSDVRHLRGEP